MSHLRAPAPDAPLTAAAVLFVAAIVAMPSAASARCKNAAPTAVCRTLESAPRADPKHKHTQAVIEVYKRLNDPFAALSGRDTGLVVLAESARMGQGKAARPIPPAAYICPGAPPAIYVPWTLVELVLDKRKYPIDFLAFVIGHELGHRANDFDLDGCQLAAFQRPGKGVHEEELADKRSAFFTAVAGYSTRAVAHKQIVSDFLAREYNVRKFTRDKRHKALMSSLQHMDALENLYQVALISAFSGDLAAADRLLAWSDELVRHRGVPLPELVLVRAMVLMLRAAPNAPWLGKAKLPSDASHLRCAPIFPAHSAMHEEPEAGAGVRAAISDRDAALKALKKAARLLDRADDLGAPKLAVVAARGCLAFYLGKPSAARQHNAEARKLAAKRGAKAQTDVYATLASNDALFAFQADVLKRRAPAAKGKKRKKWARALAKRKRTFKANRVVVELVKAFVALPKRVPAKEPARPKCRKKTPLVRIKNVALTAKPDLGACPVGWTLAHTVPPLAAARNSGTRVGVTTCTNAKQPGVRWVRVKLPALTSPPSQAVEVAMRVYDGRKVKLPNLAALACGCDELAGQGTSDRGQRAWMAACDKLGFGVGVAFTRRDGQTATLATLD